MYGLRNVTYEEEARGSLSCCNPLLKKGERILQGSPVSDGKLGTPKLIHCMVYGRCNYQQCLW